MKLISATPRKSCSAPGIASAIPHPGSGRSVWQGLAVVLPGQGPAAGPVSVRWVDLATACGGSLRKALEEQAIGCVLLKEAPSPNDLAYLRAVLDGDGAVLRCGLPDPREVVHRHNGGPRETEGQVIGRCLWPAQPIGWEEVVVEVLDDLNEVDRPSLVAAPPTVIGAGANTPVTENVAYGNSWAPTAPVAPEARETPDAVAAKRTVTNTNDAPVAGTYASQRVQSGQATSRHQLRQKRQPGPVHPPQPPPRQPPRGAGFSPSLGDKPADVALPMPAGGRGPQQPVARPTRPPRRRPVISSRSTTRRSSSARSR